MTNTDIAKQVILCINPLVPSLDTDSFESWASPRPLREEIREFGWHSLPTVRKMLSDVVAILDRPTSP